MENLICIAREVEVAETKYWLKLAIPEKDKDPCQDSHIMAWMFL